MVTQFTAKYSCASPRISWRRLYIYISIYLQPFWLKRLSDSGILRRTLLRLKWIELVAQQTSDRSRGSRDIELSSNQCWAFHLALRTRSCTSGSRRSNSTSVCVLLTPASTIAFPEVTAGDFYLDRCRATNHEVYVRHDIQPCSYSVHQVALRCLQGL